MSAQQFDADLFAEESAQTKYYEMKASARPFIEPKLVPQQKKLMQMASHDNISIHSAPTLTRSSCYDCQLAYRGQTKKMGQK